MIISDAKTLMARDKLVWQGCRSLALLVALDGGPSSSRKDPWHHAASLLSSAIVDKSHKIYQTMIIEQYWTIWILKYVEIETSIRFWQTWLVAADPQNCRFVDPLGLTCSRKRCISSLSSWLSFLRFHFVMFWRFHSETLQTSGHWLW